MNIPTFKDLELKAITVVSSEIQPWLFWFDENVPKIKCWRIWVKQVKNYGIYGKRGKNYYFAHFYCRIRFFSYSIWVLWSPSNGCLGEFSHWDRSSSIHRMSLMNIDALSKAHFNFVAFYSTLAPGIRNDVRIRWILNVNIFIYICFWIDEMLPNEFQHQRMSSYFR